MDSLQVADVLVSSDGRGLPEGTPPSRWPRRTQGERTPSRLLRDADGVSRGHAARSSPPPDGASRWSDAETETRRREEAEDNEGREEQSKTDQGKAKREEAEPRAKRRKRKRALKGIEEKQRPSEREKRRANDLAEKTKRKQERGRTEDHPERRTNEESLKPHSNGTKRRMNHYGGNEDGNEKASHQNQTETKKPPNNRRTKP